MLVPGAAVSGRRLRAVSVHLIRGGRGGRRSLFLWALPRDARLLRLGGAAVSAQLPACLLVRSPIGSNIERYGVLLAGPLLLCALLRRPRDRAAPAARSACCGPARASPSGSCGGPVRETRAVAGSEATSASYYAPVERFLASDAAGPVRIEVPLTRSHWEAALLAPSVSLARGWEKQLEEPLRRGAAGARADVPRPTSAGCTSRRSPMWRFRMSAGSVQRPRGPAHPRGPAVSAAGLQERALAHLCGALADAARLRAGRADGARPRLLRAGRGAPGSFQVRVHFTRYWTLLRGHGVRGARARAAGRG